MYFSGKGLAASRPAGRGRRFGLAGFATALLSLGLACQSHAQSTTLLEQWPLTTDNTAAVVAPGVTASVPTFTGFVLSDNSTASGPIPGYSVARG